MPIISDTQTPEAVLKLVGERFRNRRLSRDLSVDSIAGMTGVNRKTVLKLETGGDVQFLTLIKLLRGMNMLGLLEAVFPDIEPVGAAISRRGEPRKRARARKRTASTRRAQP